MKVVMFESIIAEKACSKPAFMEASLVLPSLSSSFILSKTTTLASTAIPMVKIIPAILGKVRVKLKAERTLNII